MTLNKKGDLIPWYLQKYYWWAYIHPWAIAFWDHPVLLNVVLFGNYRRLRNRLLSYLSPDKRIVLFGCCYGDLMKHLSQNSASLTIIDCVQQQLDHGRSKCSPHTLLADVADTGLPGGSADIVIMFFLLHELPPDWKKKALTEAYRVAGKDGKVLICEFSQPAWWNPFGYLERLIFKLFEPFARDIFSWTWGQGAEQHYFGMLYRIIKSDMISAQEAQSPEIVEAAREAELQVNSERVSSANFQALSN